VARMSAPQPAYRALFIGDSVPYSIAKNWQPDPSQVVIGNMALPSCDGARGGTIRFPLNLYVQDKPDCQRWPEMWPDAFSLFQPSGVFVMLGMAALQDRAVDGVYTRPCEYRYDSWYEREVDARLTFIEQQTKGVIMLAISPYADDSSIGVLPVNHRARTDCLNDIYKDVVKRHPAVDLVDFNAWMCPQGVCRDQIEGQPFRADGLHFTPPAAKAAGEWLVERAKLAGLARAHQEDEWAAARMAQSMGVGPGGVPVSTTTAPVPSPPPVPVSNR